ncbi:MAG: carboxylesterase family protein [Spirochaetales bacterium]|nr:carboxylesterase family protein [Spirochaetales bacterium]
MKRMSRNYLWISFSVLLLFIYTGCQSNQTAKVLPEFVSGTIQTTVYGQVEGYNDPDYGTLIWKGIPYAKAPSGDLRWKEAVDPEPWTDIYDATKAGNVGVQSSWGKTFGSEDCLNLDIYRPDSNENGLPVLVYIHGGNNQTGTSEELNARILANNVNAVVVSVNYRLGLLGFNNLPALRSDNELESSGNYAILDIAKSLDWVNQNITSFGGNPENITISGFSAGGRDVMAMLISPVFKGKFQKAISLSGGMTLADYNMSAELIAKAIAPLAVEDGVKGTEEDAEAWLLTDAQDVKDYLYSIAPERLANLMSNAGIRMAVFPHLYNDGVVLPKEGFDTENYNNVPLIMLTGSDEFSLFSRYDGTFVKSVSDDDIIAANENGAKYLYAYKYGSKLYELFNAQESAERMFDKYDAPIYTCDFDFGDNPEIVGDKMGHIFGSFHGIWIPFLAGEPSGFSGMFPESFTGAGTQDLAAKFTLYIKNFLWAGDPNSEGLVEWKAWESATEGPAQLHLDADKDSAVITMTDERADYSAILAEMDADTTIPEDVKAQLNSGVLSGRWFSGQLDEYYKNTNLWIGVK